MNLAEIISNNVYFSILIGIVITITVYYIEKTHKENESKIKKYLKITLASTIIFWLGLYIKNNKNNLVGGGNTDSINTLKIDDLNLDDPFN